MHFVNVSVARFLDIDLEHSLALWTKWSRDRDPRNWTDTVVISQSLIPREARPKASRSGVYNFVPQRAQAGWNLVWSLRSYLFICEVGVCRKWRHKAVRWWPNGMRRRKTQIFGTEGRGFESCKVFFFFLLFLFFSFFFCFESWAFPWAFPFFRFSFWIKIK